FKAYTSDLGAAQFRSLADKVSKEEQTPRAAPPPGAPPRLIGQSMAPVGEKLLHAYVEDIVGPITRPPPPTAGGFGGGGGGSGRGRGANFGQVGPGGVVPTGAPLVIAIKTVPDDMTYSVKNFTVKPGQYVRITLTNPDEMQHNLVFVRPGSVEDVGELVNV